MPMGSSSIPEGGLLACEGGAGRVTRMDLDSGDITVLADEYDGLPLQAPNDLVQDRQGRIYFTSRPGVKRKGNVNAVYRIDPDGSLHQLLRDPEVHVPNGIVLSPDQRTLFLIDADGGEGRNRNITAHDLLPDGTLANRRVIVDFFPGRSGDGMCVDAKGHLYVAAGLHARRGSQRDAGHAARHPRALARRRASGVCGNARRHRHQLHLRRPRPAHPLRDLRAFVAECADPEPRAAPGPGTGFARVIGSGTTHPKRRRPMTRETCVIRGRSGLES